MARSFADCLRAHEQQKARLAEQEAKLKADERKARTRQLIRAGGLVDKAGLLELEPNALYGALLSLKDGAANTQQIGQWAALGGRAGIGPVARRHRPATFWAGLCKAGVPRSRDGLPGRKFQMDCRSRGSKRAKLQLSSGQVRG
jgi:hypothetical protein